MRAALDRGHVHPEDILATIGRVIVEEGKPTADTLDIVGVRRQRITRDRMKANGVWP